MKTLIMIVLLAAAFYAGWHYAPQLKPFMDAVSTDIDSAVTEMNKKSEELKQVDPK